MSPRRRRRTVLLAGGAAVVMGSLAVLWELSAPGPPPPLPPEHVADIANGERLFHAGSCLACHLPGPRAATTDPGLPAGGAAFKTPVGTFYPQNLTPDLQTGIGRWTPADFVRAMMRGISPKGEHYFPAFPYTSFRGMTVGDVLDVRAYLMTLRPIRSPEIPADVPLRWLARRGVGLWNRLALRHPVPIPDPGRNAVWRRGAYLVRGPGHCGECHTPRNLLMILDPDPRRALSGAPHPAGEGHVPSLRGLVARGRYKDAADLALALRYGATLGFDRLESGGMGLIQTNLGQLPESDLQAMAVYLVSLD
jgi:mono/diheme cytochrome c family protein